MMFADRDYERPEDEGVGSEKQRPDVNVVNWQDRDYSVVTIRCKDRPKLLFDTICTLTDMLYVVFHGNVEAEGPQAYQVSGCLFWELRVDHINVCILIYFRICRNIVSDILMALR